MTAKRPNQRMIDLFDEFTHGRMSRRDFMERLAKLAGGAAAAAATVPVLQNNYAEAGIVPEDDPRLVTETASYVVDGTTMSGYLARLKDGEDRPAVVVIHENRGLNPHIKDVARRMALEGFLAFAPDALSPVGGTPVDEDRAREMIYELDREATLARMVAAVAYLAEHPESTGKVGAVGFCWGGGMVNRLAVELGSDLQAGVPFYGAAAASEDVSRIEASMLIVYASTDPRINAMWPDYEAALERNGVDYEMEMYDGTLHGFHNNSTPRYNEVAAGMAWNRTVGFFRDNLSG